MPYGRKYLHFLFHGIPHPKLRQALLLLCMIKYPSIIIECIIIVSHSLYSILPGGLVQREKLTGERWIIPNMDIFFCFPHVVE